MNSKHAFVGFTVILLALYSTQGLPAGIMEEDKLVGEEGSASNGTVISAGETLLLQNGSSTSLASDTVSITANGTSASPAGLQFSQNIFSDNDNYLNTDGVDVTFDDAEADTDGVDLTNEQDSYLDVTASVDGAEQITFSEKPAVSSNFSVSAMVISDWVTLNNGTGLPGISGGWGWNKA